MKSVLITGVSRGIGLSIAKEFIQNDYFVFGTSRSKFDLSKALESNNCKHLIVDVNDRDSITSIMKDIPGENNTLDCLVNNAGITADQLFIRMKDSEWDDVINTNLTGIFNITKPVSKMMLKQKSGSIINISSVSGLMGNAGQVNYSSSKSALLGFTKSLAKELAPRGINVNCICPGFIESDMTNELTSDQRDQALSQIPLGNFGSDTDIAKLTLFLSSDNAKYITGQSISVDGGMYM
ncbi:MAG: beta-ketoacyl-ACP reductase [Gammaproteobacteria bacterium]|jgi:3-oxoacyl-[acyl-carrier protein] reductase|nr:MAG: beta-ketoacyl-ACP reductase [Gammaproteobacteria bacterium]